MTAAGKPAILIPLPTATDDHQRKNAEALAAAGAAEVLLQTDATGTALAARIAALAGDRRGAAQLEARRARRWPVQTRRRSIVGSGTGAGGSRSVLGKTRRVHFIGIGGIGMSGIAELLANLGYVVTGSDEKRSPVTDRLKTLGVHVDSGMRPSRWRVRTSWWCRRRCGETNPEVAEALRRHIPVIPRAEMLAELMRLRVRDRRRRRARQDDDDVDDCAGARTRGTRSDGGDRRPVERLRQQRASRPRRADGGRSG